MRAAVLRSCPGPLEIDEVTVAAPSGREVLVRTGAAGLCHSDLHALKGDMEVPVPTVMGHESAGVVEAVGPDASYVKPGDHVVACLSAFCGHCEDCLSGRPFLCQSPELRRSTDETTRLSDAGGPVGQFANLGSFAEQMLVHENALVKIDPDLPLPQAALVGCAVTTGIGAVVHTADVRPGATVAVIGCGGVGLNCVQGAVLAGALRVIAVDVLPAKLDLARRFGATDTVDASSVDAVATVVEMTAGGVEYAFEAIGLPRTAEQAFAMLRRGGVATVVGVLPRGSSVSLPAAGVLGRRFQGSVMGSNRFRLDIPRYLGLYRQGRLNLDDLVSRRIALDDVNAGYAALGEGAVARSVVVF